ncbi:MAG: S26 family signal peptidase [Thermoplasmata archaeon]|nr:S26 family signal peptidase [Thermoplasmata archaeon]MCI4356360.1 S26 family signal peptidase [Thermoplasmata archaeon]
MATNGGARAPFLRRWRSLRVVVEDDSMRPTLLPGDRLWVDPHGAAVAPGMIVVLPDPGPERRWLVKRTAAVGPATVYVVRAGVDVRSAGSLEVPPPDAIDQCDLPGGTVYVVSDGPTVSRDSRTFGPVPLRSVVGVAWWRYAPRERAGPLIARPKV